MFLSSYILAFVITVAIELPILFMLISRTPMFMAAGVLINLITNPAANFAYSTLASPPFPDLRVIFAIEFVVIIAEWKLLEYVLSQKSKNLLLVSALMNTVSFSVGALLLW